LNLFNIRVLFFKVFYDRRWTLSTSDLPSCQSRVYRWLKMHASLGPVSASSLVTIVVELPATIVIPPLNMRISFPPHRPIFNGLVCLQIDSISCFCACICYFNFLKELIYGFGWFHDLLCLDFLRLVLLRVRDLVIVLFVSEHQVPVTLIRFCLNLFEVHEIDLIEKELFFILNVKLLFEIKATRKMKSKGS
jgi:hypothetical protein